MYGLAHRPALGAFRHAQTIGAPPRAADSVESIELFLDEWEAGVQAARKPAVELAGEAELRILHAFSAPSAGNGVTSAMHRNKSAYAVQITQHRPQHIAAACPPADSQVMAGGWGGYPTATAARQQRPQQSANANMGATSDDVDALVEQWEAGASVPSCSWALPASPGIIRASLPPAQRQWMPPNTSTVPRVFLPKPEPKAPRPVVEVSSKQKVQWKVYDELAKMADAVVDAMVPVTPRGRISCPGAVTRRSLSPISVTPPESSQVCSDFRVQHAYEASGISALNDKLAIVRRSSPPHASKVCCPQQAATTDQQLCKEQRVAASMWSREHGNSHRGESQHPVTLLVSDPTLKRRFLMFQAILHRSVDVLTAAVLAAAASIIYIRQPYHQVAGGFVIMLHILRMVFVIVASPQMHTALRETVAFSVGLFTVGYFALWCCYPTILAMLKEQNSNEYWWFQAFGIVGLIASVLSMSVRFQRSCQLQLVIATACLVAFPFVALVDADVGNWTFWSFIFTGCTEIVVAGFMLPASLLYLVESRQRAHFLSPGRSTNPENLTNPS